MATYALIHGASSDSWYWHLVAPELQARGHDVIAPDLPKELVERLEAYRAQFNNFETTRAVLRPQSGG